MQLTYQGIEIFLRDLYQTVAQGENQSLQLGVDSSFLKMLAMWLRSVLRAMLSFSAIPSLSKPFCQCLKYSISLGVSFSMV